MRFLRGLAAGLLALAAVAATAADEEYFLDGAQKKELLLYGTITGRDQAQYNIWLVPGYVPPARHVPKGWRAAGKDLQEYGKPAYYRAAREIAVKTMLYGRHDILGEFTVDGTRKAWRDAASAANRRVQKRVFGWWLAWPWAVVEASTISAVRVGLGVPGGIGVWGAGALGVPAGALVAPAAMAVGHAGGEGVALPVAGAAWNTLVAPPLALAGQQPAPERADGWWMKRLRDPAEDDMRARVAAWQAGWQGAPELLAPREALVVRQKERQAAIDALRARLDAETRAWHDEQAAAEAAWQARALERALAAVPGLRRELADQGYGPARLEAEREVFLGVLTGGGLDPAGAARVVDALIGR